MGYTNKHTLLQKISLKSELKALECVVTSSVAGFLLLKDHELWAVLLMAMWLSCHFIFDKIKKL